MDVLRAVFLLAATLSMGLVAGVFGLYWHAVMPGLAKADDRTFVGAFQALDRGIMNPWFLLTNFVGALAFPLVAGLLLLGQPAFVWVVVAFVLYLVVFVMTIAINVPMNDALKAAGDPNQIDNAAARKAFNEARWVSSNNVRVVLSTVAFGLLAWALVVFGQS
ncbi:anthrone oxygenase family protein [Tenggerimyces flavus]|uniref:DUF1772 domain-containing protein n=1 Tax=Tenggerimyces flavus TaxID=1708749 RepID=A0ABV7YSU8_9ACTN|nr:anthrone oxygenase family protein [Tenggerimyces flavus]MBM7784381.1 putative membrane protein [Tenggerimyces flavus]